MIYIVTYDLNTRRKYTGLTDALKGFPEWWHYMDSAWIIKTDDSVEKVYERLKPHINSETDNLLIFELGKQRRGWLPKKAWDWIRERLGK